MHVRNFIPIFLASLAVASPFVEDTVNEGEQNTKVTEATQAKKPGTWNKHDFVVSGFEAKLERNRYSPGYTQTDIEMVIEDENSGTKFNCEFHPEYATPDGFHECSSDYALGAPTFSVALVKGRAATHNEKSNEFGLMLRREIDGQADVTGGTWVQVNCNTISGETSADTITTCYPNESLIRVPVNGKAQKACGRVSKLFGRCKDE